MWQKLCFAFVVAAIGGTKCSIMEVDAKKEVEAGASHGSSKLAEAVKLIRKDFEDVKNVIESHQQQNNATCISKKEFADLKAACTSKQQQQGRQTESVQSSLLCEYRTHDKCFLRGIVCTT